MLVLSRKKNEAIVVNGDITITIVDIQGDRVRLGVVAPRNIPVHRQEIQSVIDQTRRAETQLAEALPRSFEPRKLL